MQDLELTDDYIGSCVSKVGGGPPSKTCISVWRRTFDGDADWYPGKTEQQKTKPGPKKLLTPQKATAIAKSVMASKRLGIEPCASLARENCPVATLNPETQEPFTDKYILQVFKERCHDDGSVVPWAQWNPLQKTALPQWLREMRVVWGKLLLAAGESAGWYHRHCVWVDPCYNVLTTSRRQAFDQDMAKFGKGKRWMSEDKRKYSRNLRSSPYGGKQCQFGDRKVWWFIVLSRGHVHIEVMGPEWKQTGCGMSEFVARLPDVLPKMVGRSEALPRVICSDRGPGFYQSSTGHITNEYCAALKRHGFRAFAGEDASSQPPDVPDVLVHETAVAWIRVYLKKHSFSKRGSLDDQEQKLRGILAECVQHINSNHDVDGLCRAFPGRLEKLVNVTKGDRLRS